MSSRQAKNGDRAPRTGDLIIPPAMQQTERPGKKRVLLGDLKPVRWPGYLALTVVTLLVFSPIFLSDLLWPEYETVPRGEFTSMSHWTEAWSPESIRENDPLTLTSYFAEQLIPLPKASVHRAINLCLHLMAALLLLKIIESLKIPGAFSAALVFAIHPAVVPTLFWSGYREMITATVFALAALYFCIRNRDGFDFSALLGLSLISYIIHPGTLALPLVMALTIRYQHRYFHLADYNRLLPVACLALFVAVWLQPGSAVAELAAEDRLLSTSSQNLYFFIQQSLLPTNFALFHPFSNNQGFSVGATNEVLPFLFFAPFYVLIFINFRRLWARGFFLGLTGFLLFALGGAFRLGSFIDGAPARETAALYLALPFAVATVVCGIASAFYQAGRSGGSLWKLVFGLFLFLQVSVTASSTLALRQDSAIWEDMSARWPGAWEPKVAYLESIKTEEGYPLPPDRAVRLLRSTLKLNPDLLDQRHDLLDLYLREDQTANALREYQRILRESEPSDAFLAEAADFFDIMGQRWEATKARDRISTVTPTNEKTEKNSP